MLWVLSVAGALLFSGIAIGAIMSRIFGPAPHAIILTLLAASLILAVNVSKNGRKP